jgi:hypothetical protein
MQFEVNALLSRASLVCALCTWFCAGCSPSPEQSDLVEVPAVPDAGKPEKKPDNSPSTAGCVTVDIDGKAVVEQLPNFTARFQLGASYDRTLMLFGGMPVEQPDAPSRAYVFGLDKMDAQRIAEKYPDFYLCSSIGGQEAAAYITVYDIVPASCEVYQQLVAALRVFNFNDSTGGDRTSLRLEGAPLTVMSVTAVASGQDVSDQVADNRFQLITSVKQLTGESLLDFGTSK